MFDPMNVMGGKGGLLRWEKAKLARADRVHLTQKGYQKLADAFVKDLFSEMQYREAVADKLRQERLSSLNARQNVAALDDDPDAASSTSDKEGGR